MKGFKETGEVNIGKKTLQFFQTQLKDQSYKVSKIYGFWNLFVHSNVIMKEEHFILPDFNIHVKLKDQSSNELFKKTVESSYSILESDTKVKTLAPSDIDNSSGQSSYIKNLSKKVNLNSLTYAYENFFLYNLENIIKPTFATEVQLEFSICGLISFLGETKTNNKLNLIEPGDNLKFHLIEDVYKNSLSFELGKVHTKKSFNVISNRVFNFAILQTNKKNKRMGEKRATSVQIIDTIRMLGIQDNDVNFLNPITISISSDTVIQKLTKYKKYRYRFLLESLLFSLNIKKRHRCNLISCEGLSDTKQALINSKSTSLLGVCYLK